MLIALTIYGVLAFPQASQPPTLAVACSANPGTVSPGATVTITATGFSSQNRHMSYSFKASSGAISPAGASTATLHTAADSPGAITVTCNVVDDRGNEASKTTTVTIRP